MLANNLLVKWQGLYRVLERMSEMNYLIEMPDLWTKNNLFHSLKPVR